MASRGLRLTVNRNMTVLADEMGRALDPLPPTKEMYKSSPRPRTTAACRHTAVAPRHGQDVVVDPAGNAFSVRLHLAQHLNHEQRVVKLEATVAGLEEQVDTHQRLMHDLRREDFVTQGAFMAAQLCKADQGALQSLRRKLDLVCELLISAGMLEETASGGLGIREEEERSESRAEVQEAGAEAANTAFLEEGLACVEESIERVEREAKAASKEAQRAAAEAADATARSEKAISQCRRVDERCTKLDELSRRGEARSAKAVQECRGRLDQSLEGSAERVETNSKRIFRLAAEVEEFVKATQGPSAATRSLAAIHGETGQTVAVEAPPLLPRQQRPSGTTEPSADEAVHRREAGPCAAAAVMTKDGPKKEGELLSTHEENQMERAPGRPGLLNQDLTREEAHARSSFLAERLQQAMSPPGWRRRHSTYISRRVAASSKDETLLVAGPVRPHEDGPAAAEQTSWSRASSWPSLEKAVPLADRDKVDKDADAKAEDAFRGRRDPETVDLEMPLFSGERSGTTATDVGDEGGISASIVQPNDDPTGARDVEERTTRHSHQSESSPESHQVGHVDTTGEDPRSSAPLSSLARMTAKEVAQALSTTAVAKRCSTGTLDTAFDALLVRSTSPGSRLANLRDTPTLHSHGDTWGAKSSSSDGSSTTATSRHPDHPKPLECGASL